MVHLGDIPPKFIKIISNAVSTFLLIALFFILQYLFDLDFLCSCRPGGHRNDGLFMVTPPFILTFMVTLIDSFYQKWIFSCCSNHCWNNCCSFIGKFLVKYLYLGAVWISTVLFDGDWYYCLKTNQNTNQTGLPCKKDLTFEEILIRNDYQNTSRDLAFLVIFCGILVFWIFECVAAYICRRMMWKRSSVSRWDLFYPPYYRGIYEDLLAEEVSSRLKEELTRIAKERAKQLCEKHIKTIENHELPERTTNLDGSNGTNPNNPSANEDGNLSGNVDDNLNDNVNVNLIDHVNDNTNGNNENDNIFDTWQNISHAYFYLEEGFVQENE